MAAFPQTEDHRPRSWYARAIRAVAMIVSLQPVRWPGAELPPEGVHCGSRINGRSTASLQAIGEAVSPHSGLAGAVSAEEFAKLSQGEHSETGE